MVSGAVRVDAWAWAVRLYKTRSAATAACRAGHIRVDGERAKPAQPVRIGSTIRAVTPGGERIVVVRELVVKRVGAPAAAAAMEDLTPPPPPPEERALAVGRDRGAGRPTKRDRRRLDEFLGQ